MNYSDDIDDFEEGYQHGWWTWQKLQEFGWTSPRECLARMEEDYRKEVAKLPQLKPELAAVYKRYMNGVIQGARISLGGMIKQGK